jgi:hypothetical protein
MSFLRVDPADMTHDDARFSIRTFPQTQGAAELNALGTHPIVLFFVTLAQELEIHPPEGAAPHRALPVLLRYYGARCGAAPFTIKGRQREKNVQKDLHAYYLDFVRDSPCVPEDKRKEYRCTEVSRIVKSGSSVITGRKLLVAWGSNFCTPRAAPGDGDG